MRPHAWTEKKVACGKDGVGLFWMCPVCGACGGPKSPHFASLESPMWRPFLPNKGLFLSEDCDRAKEEIKAFKKAKKGRRRHP